MLTSRTLERLMNNPEEIAQKAGTNTTVAFKVLEAARDEFVSRRRQPAPPAPEGGISIRAAGRKYKIGSATISRWVKRGILKPLLRTQNEVYIAETDISSIAEKYNQSRGRGKRTIMKEYLRKEAVSSLPTAA